MSGRKNCKLTLLWMRSYSRMYFPEGSGEEGSTKDQVVGTCRRTRTSLVQIRRLGSSDTETLHDD